MILLKYMSSFIYNVVRSPSVTTVYNIRVYTVIMFMLFAVYFGYRV